MAAALRRAGRDDFVVLEKAGDDRRHLAGQHLPGLRLRRPAPPVLVLVRAQPGLVARRTPRQPEILDYLRGVRRPYRPAPVHPAADPGDRGRWVADGALAGATASGGDVHGLRRSYSAPGPLHRPASPASWPRLLRRRGVPLGPLGPRVRPARQAGGGDRHRGVGDPVRAADRAAGRPAGRVPAHRRRGCCPGPTGPSAPGGRTCSGGYRWRTGRARAGLYWRSEAARARLHRAAPDA